MKRLKSSIGIEPINLANKRIHSPYNQKDDVLYVQQLLNKCFRHQLGFSPLKEDGICGKKTIAAIKQFQMAHVKGIRSDGLIEKNGSTYTALLDISRSSASVNVNQFLRMYGDIARTTGRKWKIPASVLLAQAAHESGWGRHVKNNAFFGIKGKSSSGDSVAFKTTEFMDGKKISTTGSFRAYRNFEEAADDYGRFLSENPRYKKCFVATDATQFVQALVAAGYATDPKYAEKILNVINKNGLAKYDH